MPPKEGNRNNRRQVSGNVENPFIHVPFSAGDLTGYKVSGGARKELVEVTSGYRRQLVHHLSNAHDTLMPTMARFPDTLSNIVIKLRDTAIAKSHRPTELATRAGLLPAGQGRLDEMIVGGREVNLELLRQVILQNNTKAIRANLSAITSFEAWTQARRNPEGVSALKARGSALLHVFHYISQDASEFALEGVIQMLDVAGIRYSLIRQHRGQPLLHLHQLHDVARAELENSLSHPSIRSVIAEPMYGSPAHAGIAPTVFAVPLVPAPAPELPVVGVFDTGVSPGADALTPWIISQDRYVLPPDTDHVHGTAVASLVAAGSILNDSHELFPVAGCLVHDVAGLEVTGQSFSVLELRLREALTARPDIKVWNISFGSEVPCNDQEFGVFARALDQLSDEFGVLFVVAAGNYIDEPRRGWPAETGLEDRVSDPADSVRALTVGAITHLEGPDTLVSIDSPAPYSRRGPGPLFSPKPDVVHLGGGVHAPWQSGDSSIAILQPDGGLGRLFGTSFSAPIAAGMAAHTWSALSGGNQLNPTPSLVKALLIHAAQLSGDGFSPLERRYYGAGLPRDVLSTLYDSDDSFTLVFDAKLEAGAYRWRKAPYPIPDVLIQNGKFRGEVIITAAYSPPLDSSAGAEYVRANVEISFGLLDGDAITGKVPMDREPGIDTLEKAQIEHGGKWSPVKIHRARFPKGVSGENWALQAQCSLRTFEPRLEESLSVTIAVTLRALDGNSAVHSSGLRALMNTNWVSQQLPARVPVTT
ncbi:S8 family anti-phage peptidase IteS [Pseudomonas sp. MAG002Y]|uniref:S8 family anti-phage peptidase IteS n=1 Tax=Pseudomonas sp. MAG002Y TaxID=2678690 RepID=UPI001C608BA9|nr:S8 family anti-phage peptidase IteS [Pseudomonas sp. MAG002Y]MBW5416334.1 S8 family serine peptidase [Pseudomonas sp. MAG002Y]